MQQSEHWLSLDSIFTLHFRLPAKPSPIQSIVLTAMLLPRRQRWQFTLEALLMSQVFVMSPGPFLSMWLCILSALKLLRSVSSLDLRLQLTLPFLKCSYQKTGWGSWGCSAWRREGCVQISQHLPVPEEVLPGSWRGPLHQELRCGTRGVGSNWQRVDVD